ncbi:MAG: mannose-1-phosphate guanylyltransferase [Oscillospiraceae bacterium]|nr:mannose-1-phosphate guanylyltransferase [Oscillospiraceae bacterium]
MKKYGVIMAGGGGTRFWPLSRQKTPKQFLNLTGKEKMVNEAIDRLAYTVDKADIFVVTNATQSEMMRQTTTGRVQPNHILAEPSAQNTAACVGYTAMEILRKYGDGIMIVTPSDAYIKDTPAFTRVLSQAVEAAQTQDKLVTIGITPTFAATGYGYIKFENAGSGAMPVLEFKEKPDEETARAYLATGQYAWNSGMFIWKASTILKLFQALIPDIYALLEKIGDAMGTPEEKAVTEAVYPKIRKISVDYAIMEPSAAAGDVLVVAGEFGWNDVGSWDMMGALYDPDARGNLAIGDVLAMDTSDSVLYSSGKLIAAVGVDNLIVVETPDAVLVCPKDRAQDVKLVVDALRDAGRNELL